MEIKIITYLFCSTLDWCKLWYKYNVYRGTIYVGMSVHKVDAQSVCV